MILVALATVLAVSIAFGTAMTARRSVSSFTVEQGLMMGGGAEAIAAQVLTEDMGRRGSAQTGQSDYPGERWNSNLPPQEFAEDVVVEAKLEDESGKFNLNSIIDGKGDVDRMAMQLLERLLEAAELERKWAPLIADFIDPDRNPYPEGGGGEDNTYTLQNPGYRAANTWLTSVSELMAIPGFGRERYLKLLPHVTALPPEERTINVCFATAELLDAVESVYGQSHVENNVQARKSDPQGFAQQRSGRCFPGLQFFSAQIGPNSALPADDKGALLAKLVEQSTYFRLHTWVSIGTTRFALYSLLKRDAVGVILVYRTFGTE